MTTRPSILPDLPPRRPALVDVIVPLYESAGTIAQTLASLQAQSLIDWRAIIVDDGSRDAGPAIALEMARRDPRLIVVRQPNRGLAGARNGGLPFVSARYVAFLDADDWLLPRGLEILVGAAERAGLPAASGSFELRDAHGAPLGRTIGAAAAPFGLDELLDRNPIGVHACVVRRDRLPLDAFDESLPVVEDYDLWLRLAHEGVRWAPAPEPVAAYRLRPGSLSKNGPLMARTLARIVDAAYERARAEARWAHLDLSSERRRRALLAHALTYAGVAAVLDPSPDKHEASRVLAELAPEGEIDEARCAWALYWSIVFGLGQIPQVPAPAEADAPAPGWALAAGGWARRLVRDGRLRPAQMPRVLGELARHLVSQHDIAQRICDRCARRTHDYKNGPREIVLAGMGHNGRLLAELARARGLAVRARDDRFAAALREGRPILNLPVGVSAEPMDAPLGRATLVLTPEDDRALLGRFAHEPALVRWALVRDELAGAARRAVEAWLSPPAASTALPAARAA